MAHKFDVTFEGDHVRAFSAGGKNLKHATAIWKEVVNVCREHNCYHVLCVSNSKRPMRIIDAYDHAELFQSLGIDKHFRVAWVELAEEAEESTKFITIVLSNRGLPGQVFGTEEEARRWLLDEPGNMGYLGSE